MPRYRIRVEYHGGFFRGWQRQASARTVQQTLEEAVAAVCREETAIVGAGRTDSGVHALGQAAHFDLEAEWEGGRLRDAVNSQLWKAGVAVLQAERASDDFHARFDAIERSYSYRIALRRAPLALERGLVWRVGRNLDADRMRRAASFLTGRHDFTTFRAVHCQASSPLRTLDALDVVRDGDRIEIRARARSFLQHQVRSMVGTLERVGAGAWRPEEVRAALEARDRAACGPVAPADGLYLERVRYASGSGAQDRLPEATDADIVERERPRSSDGRATAS